MASLFKMSGKPFWYLRHKVDGAWKKSSTGLRHDDPNDTAKARELRASAEAKEYRNSPAVAVGWQWVDPFLESSGLAPQSVVRYEGAWRWLQVFLQENHLDVTQVRYTHVADYLAWRVGRKKKSGKTAGRNTAIQEIKILAMILGEAVRRGLIVASPLAVLKLRKDKPPKKRAFTPEEIDRCRAALADQEEWLRVSFEIALCTGCRLRETRIPLSCIDLDNVPPTMTFPAPKGGEDKAFSIPVPTQLLGMFRRMKEEGRQYTFAAFPFQPSRRWQQFFKVMKIEGVCFHCLRVTKITLMRREGVPREAAMRLVNHSSELIHMNYDRHQVKDVAKYSDAGIAGTASAK